MEMCNKLPNTNIDDVSAALSMGSNRLLSKAYLKGGMGDGGGCHPRDNIAMSYLAKKLDLSYDFFESIMLQRENQTVWLAQEILKHAKNRAIFILGKSFKAETNIVTGSPSIFLHNELKKISKNKIFIWDPYVDDYNYEDMIKKNNLEKIKKVFFIGTKHEYFLKFQFPKDCIIIDPWRYLKKRRVEKLIEIGINQ